MDSLIVPKDLIDEELLACIIPKRAVCELMARYGNIQGILQVELEDVQRFKGISGRGIQKIKVLQEFTRRIQRGSGEVRKICTPQDVSKRMYNMRYLEVEQVRILLLNTKNGIIGEEFISQGSINSTIVGPREIFGKAVRRLAAAIILVHNHPSGDVTPSREDNVITQKIKDSGEMLGIPLLDHVIIGRDGYYSYKENDDL